MKEPMDHKQHWESVYATKHVGEVSWHQADPKVSMALILAASPPPSRVIDVGGGASVLVDRLLDAGFTDVAVLDISAAAMERARRRLGPRAAAVRWIVGDVTAIDGVGTFDVWHDRAVFHFLTVAADRKKYADLLRRTVPGGGKAVIATFAPDGPTRCCGLDVVRYDAASLAAELGPGLTLLKSVPESHLTPWGKPQSFQYAVFRRVGD